MNKNILTEEKVKELGLDKKDAITENDLLGFTTIDEYAFSENLILESITIPNTITCIKDGAFELCRNLEKVIICDNVNDIGVGAFSSCSKLKNIKLPNNENFTCLRGGLFECCTSLEEIEFTDYINEIDENAFKETGFIEITIPSTITYIGNNAFSECSNLGKVTFSDATSLNTMGDSIFSECKNLKDVHIGGTMKDIPESLFYECEILDNVVFDYPENIETIKQDAFYGTALKKVKLNDGIIVEKNAFESCYKLEEVEIGEICELKRNAFSYCNELKEVICYDSVCMDKSAFYGKKGSDINLYLIKSKYAESRMNDEEYYDNVNIEGYLLGRNNDGERIILKGLVDENGNIEKF